jgi:RHS repeat-associated protein
VTYRVVSDHLGSPRYVVNVANASDVPFTAAYGAFGNVTGTGLDWMPFGFAGGIYDPDTQLVRFGARDYDASVGRWTAKDPVLPRIGGTNTYLYADGDPLNVTDPSGRDTKSCKNKCDMAFGAGIITCIVGCTQLKHPGAIGACMAACSGAVYGAIKACEDWCEENTDDEEDEQACR